MNDRDACLALLHHMQECGPISPWGVWFFLWSTADRQPNAGEAMSIVRVMIENGWPIEMKNGAYQFKEPAA